MRAVVTGGDGFVGSHLVDALVRQGADVLCIERAEAKPHWVEGLPIRYADCGLADVSRLSRYFDGVDVVFHLAALTHARRAEDFYEINAMGTAHVLQAAASLRVRPPRVVLMSSLAAIGPCRDGELLSPDSVPRPLSEYGASKLQAEAVVQAYRDRVPSTILRFSAIYGPRERAVLRLFQMVSHGVALTIGSWEREVSLVYVADAVQALLAAGKRPRAIGRTYCVAHPVPVVWTDFAKAVGQAVGRKPSLVGIPVSAARIVAVATELTATMRNTAAFFSREKLRELAQPRWVCDTSRAEAELGFRAEYPAERGIRETAAWYREARWI